MNGGSWPNSDSVTQIKPRLPRLKTATAYYCRTEALRTPCQVTPYDEELWGCSRWSIAHTRSDRDGYFLN